MNDDSALLEKYVREGSQAAFADLVRRHLPLVYSVACRQVGDAQLAEDVAQEVFHDLARKAEALVQHPALGAWLYRTTQFAAIDALRAERRRRARETIAAAMESTSSDPETPPQLRAELDRAMAALSDKDRAALMLRFFEQCPLAEVGRRLRVSEDAARMRVERALERLRSVLATHGITSTAAALGAALTGQGAILPPSALAATIAAAGVTPATATGAGMLLFMSTQKTMVGVTLAVLVGGSVWWAVTRPTDPPSSAPAHGSKVSSEPERTHVAAADADASAATVSSTALVARNNTGRDFAGEFSQLMASADTPERKEQARELLIAWGSVAPADALEAITALGLRAAEREFYAIEVFAGWASVDPEAAWAAAPRESAMVAAGLATRATNPYYQKIAGTMIVQGKAERAQQLIAEIADERTREGTFVFMIPYLAKHDFPAVAAGIATMRPDGSGKLNALAALGRALAQEFPDMAAEHALKFAPEPAIRAIVVGAVFEELGRNNQARVAADWIARAPEEFRDVALRNYFGVRGTLTPQAREQYLQKLVTDAAAR